MKKKLRYTWYETSSNFQVVDNKTGEERGMSDGVDMFLTPTGKSIRVSTPAFYKAMNDFFRTSQDEIGEAYFGR